MALTKDVSVPSYEAYMASICNLEDTNTIASNYGKYFSQACHCIFRQKAVKIRKRTGPLWFDAECRSKRIKAITAGEKVMDEADRLNLLEKCCEYRAIKQRKRHAFQQNCMRRIDDIYNYNRGELWKEFNKLLPTGMNTNMPSGDEFFEHFKSMSQTKVDFLFDYSYEDKATKWLENEKAYPIHPSVYPIEFDILNRNFTEEEIKFSISSLKDNKSAGIDSLPAEFFKVSNGIISRHITEIFNYIITTREFPEIWTTGLRSAIHKAGLKLNTKNYRGITVLPVFEKIFKIAVQRRLEFLRDAFDKTDRYNGGFLKGSRTSDNIYVLSSIIEQQLTLGQNLIVCHVDFSRAFNSVNRNNLFYKIKHSGLRGRVIDTLQNLYSKTSYRLKYNGKLTNPVHENIGVIQGGNCSPILFRKYLYDLKDYLDECTGICFSTEILLHMLWADDLCMVSCTQANAQHQLDGLSKFCSPNQMIGNETKTKYIVFGKTNDFSLVLNGKAINRVTSDKCLGNIINSMCQPNGNIFTENAEYLSNKARQSAMINLNKTGIGTLKNPRPP